MPVRAASISNGVYWVSWRLSNQGGGNTAFSLILGNSGFLTEINKINGLDIAVLHN